jgi:hypothetical protein
MSNYGLHDRAIGVRIPAEAKWIFPLNSVSKPALGPTQPPLQWVPGVLSPEAKRGRGLTLTPHPHLMLRSGMSRSYTPGERTPVPIVHEAGWAPEPVWTQRLEEKSFRLCRGSNLNHPVVQPVDKPYTD